MERRAATENDEEMNNAIRVIAAVGVGGADSVACGAYMSPRIVPATQSPTPWSKHDSATISGAAGERSSFGFAPIRLAA
jgi:hypothetical protein